MTSARKVVFLSGTRADFGKITSLISALELDPNFEPYIFITGMHALEKFGSTWREILSKHKSEVRVFNNQKTGDQLDTILAKTVAAFSDFVEEVEPDLIVVHGDRVEALAGALVGSLKGLRTAHIEGGELSGTIDDSMRNAISMLVNIHMPVSPKAASRVSNLTDSKLIFPLPPPDFDVLASGNLPELGEVARHYRIPFLPSEKFAICIFHPVFYEQDCAESQGKQLVRALIDSGTNYVVIHPNNDPGHEGILHAYKHLEGNPKFALFPTVRFEFFGTLLKHADFIIGNSSAALSEAALFNVPAINIGTRQQGRDRNGIVIDVEPESKDILKAIDRILAGAKETASTAAGAFRLASEVFLGILTRRELWATSIDNSSYRSVDK